MREAAEGLVAGRYRANLKIGEGAIGEVWEGTHVALGIKIAIKRLLPAHQGNHELIARFKREAYLLGRVRSEHVARVIDFVHDEGGPALIMEFIDGESLFDILQRRPLSVEEALALGADVLAGLDELHQAQVVHRDLKPGNIIIEGRPSGSRRAVIVDFGMGRIIPKGFDNDDEPTGITRNGIALGTLEYMAPEQILNSRGVTGAADIYALGAILYRSLSGRFPFAGDSPMALVRAKLIEEAPQLVLARGDPLALGMVQVVARALSRDLARRYQSADEMRGHLNELRAHMRPGQPIFASSPAARPAHEPIPPVSIPPPPSVPSIPSMGSAPVPRARPSGRADMPGGYPVADDKTLPLSMANRRLGPVSGPASGPVSSVPSRPAMPGYQHPPRSGRPMPRSLGQLIWTPMSQTGTSLKVVGVAALIFVGIVIGGGVGIVRALRRDAAAPPADAVETAAPALEASAKVEAPAKADATVRRDVQAKPAASDGARDVVDLDDLPTEPAAGRPQKARGARLPRRSLGANRAVVTDRGSRRRAAVPWRPSRARAEAETDAEWGPWSPSWKGQDWVVESW